MNQLGHMKTNKNCPKYRENIEIPLETSDLEKSSGKPTSLDPLSHSQQKATKKVISKGATKIAVVDAAEGDNSVSKSKVPVKFKCGSADKIPDKTIHSFEQPASSGADTTETSNKTVGKVSKIVFSNKVRSEDGQPESQKPSIVIRTPTDVDRGQVESHKPSIVIRPPANTDREQFQYHKPPILIRQPTDTDKEKSYKKIKIKRSKDVIDLDQASPDGGIDPVYQKTKKIVELSNFEQHGKRGSMLFPEESVKRKNREQRKRWEEEAKWQHAERVREQRRRYEEERRIMEEEQEKLAEITRYQESIRREREEEERQKESKKKKKKKKPDVGEEYLEDYRARRNDRRVIDRDRGTKRKALDLGRYGAESAVTTKRRRGGEVF